MQNDKLKTANAVIIDPLKEAPENTYKPKRCLGSGEPSESFRSDLRQHREMRSNRWGC